jgi:hypothetical protein
MRRSVEIKVIIWIVVVFLVLIANTILSNQAANTPVRDGELVAHSHETQTELKSHGGKVAADSLGDGACPRERPGEHARRGFSNARRQAGVRRRTGY